MGLTWQRFWGTDLEQGVRSMQRLSQVLDKMRYQRLTKDVEDQATAGLDLSMADALASLSNHTRLQETQAWLRQEVTAAVFQALYDLQHPANCSSVRKLHCNFNKGCGFGCELHHVVHCFATAVALNRTMLVHVHPTNYFKTATAWTDSLQPISGCGESTVGAGSLPLFNRADPSENAAAEELFVDIIDFGASPWDPPAMPQDVHEVAQLFTSRPEIWWVGALTSYLMRPSGASGQRHAAFKAAHDWGGLTVGVHVRRTDKVVQREAVLHHVSEYMAHVERVCDQRLPSGWQVRALRLQEDPQLLQLQEQRMAQAAAIAAGARPADVTAAAAAAAAASDTAAAAAAAGGSGRKQQRSECSVYLASDEPQVAAEMRAKYRHVHVITNDRGLQTSSVTARYTNEGFLGIYDDVMYLASCDFIVGTFSSQVSRMAYEVSMVNNTLGAADRTFAYHSVDSMWYYGGMAGFTRCAATDFTDQGRVVVRAGQRLTCAVIHKFDQATGHEVCKLLGAEQT
ncbi:hypothetical protein COO60DRAFT_22761 [Scenedesmus sp. NREL 46B-D3]|nr:hypothetical protein COO60DRAFT_22761 [Scenedesmus sp. NREL 46B-D3]